MSNGVSQGAKDCPDCMTVTKHYFGVSASSVTWSECMICGHYQEDRKSKG